jgi:hypothetical protein
MVKTLELPDNALKENMEIKNEQWGWDICRRLKNTKPIQLKF